jgi:hypothetical protein
VRIDALSVEDYILPVDVLPDGSILIKMKLLWQKKTGNVFIKPNLRAWNSVAYLFSGLHPDGFEDADSGWPRVLKYFAVEAWRRIEADEITEEELYPCDSQWCGLYDRMHTHEPDEMERRLALAADYGEPLNV